VSAPTRTATERENYVKPHVKEFLCKQDCQDGG
jgi:hypothetical protein